MFIKFTCMWETKTIEPPKPSSAFIPEWYKNTLSYIGDEKKPTGFGSTPATLKRCMPVFDAMTAGYVITTPVDVFVSQKDGAPWYEWAHFDFIKFHSLEQAPEHPVNKAKFDYPKFQNPWAIETPKGYSTFFTQPMHRDAPFKILDGIVDTDKYTDAVNFPFVLNDPMFEGLIPQGTPMAQVIPFERESWKMELGSFDDVNENRDIINKTRSRFFDAYRNLYWNRKEYK